MENPFGHVEFEVSIKYPSGDVRQAFIYKNLKLGRECGLEILIRVRRHTGDIDTLELGEINKRVSTDKGEGSAQNLECSGVQRHGEQKNKQRKPKRSD